MRKFSFSRQNIWKALAFFAAFMLVALGPRLLSHREPAGVWFPDRISNSIGDPYGEVAVRVADVTNRGQVVLVKLACETVRRTPEHELLMWFSGPVFDYRADIAAEVTNVDCLISPTQFTGGGKVLAGSSHLQDASAHLIGFVLPDEATAAKVVEQIRQTHLGKPRGLMDPRSALLLFSLHRRTGEDTNGNPFVETLMGSLVWMLKDVPTTQTKTNRISSPQDTSYYIGQTSFPKGDSIEITSVKRTEEQIVVKGHYNLVSTDRAHLGLHITTSSTNSTPTDSRQWMQISKGRGDFELIHPHPVPGLPHVTMYSSDGNDFAGVYFGNKAEALEESKLDIGHYRSSN